MYCISFAFHNFFCDSLLLWPVRRVLDASMELNYVFVLVSVAILWRPHEQAKEYAYVMELPAVSGDYSSDEEDVIEMAGVVPSAADDEDSDDEFEEEPKEK